MPKQYNIEITYYTKIEKRKYMNLNELAIRPELIKGLEEMGFTNFTEIQAESIPHALEGKDILGQAKTGTGKTAAFVVPVLNNMKPDVKDTQCLMLAPTRELAIQIAEEVKKIGKYMNITVAALFGGEDIQKQINLLKRNPQIIVATPGRCLDLLKRKKLNVSFIDFFVLDEVDEMLNMGFLEDVELIESKTTSMKQTLFFSATMPDRIVQLTKKFLKDPVIVKVDAKSLTVDKVDQSYIVCKAKQKGDVLANLLLLRKDQKIIIFTQTKRSCDEVSEYLTGLKYRVTKIHGDIPQLQRTRSINQFKEGKYDVLIASDVVARGIDIQGIDLVINYELPQDIEYYIHRIGRTGRGNAKKGEAITIVSPNIYDREFRHYERVLKCTIKEMQAPTFAEVKKVLTQQYIDNIEQNVEKELSQVYYDMAEDVKEQEDMNKVLPYLLSLAFPELAVENRQTLEVREQSGNGFKRKPGGNGGNRGRNGGGNRGRDGRSGGRDNRGGSRDGRGGNRDGGGYRGNRDGGSRDGGRDGRTSRSRDGRPNRDGRPAQNRSERPASRRSDDTHQRKGEK